ncbi:MAG: hypothetical protein ABH879_00325 [archaeon]
MDRRVVVSVTALGMSSVITQIVLIREFLTVFSGNELVFGIILANWLLLTGLGSYLGRHLEAVRYKMKLLFMSLVLIAILPVAGLVIMRILRNVLFMPGELIGIAPIIGFSSLLLLPYCLISGAMLSLACMVLGSGARDISRVYVIDSIGDIIGGVLFSFVLVYFLNSLQALFLVMIINLLAASWVSGKRLVWILSGLLIIAVALSNAEKKSASFLYPGQEILYSKWSPYGHHVVTAGEGQLNFYENGVPLYSTGDVAAAEEAVHYAMLQHPNPENVLLISGGAAAAAEILKYNVTLDYVELDPQVIDSGRLFLGLEGINAIEGDGRRYIERTDKRYDVVIVGLPDPGSIQISRFYTVEFFRSVREIAGIVSVGISSSENYMSPELARLNAVTYNTLNEVFAYVIVIPGNRNYFIASDQELSHDIGRLVGLRGIDTRYVNNNYLSGSLTPDRISYAENAVRTESRINSDRNPVSCYYHMLFWVNQFDFSSGLIILAAAVLLYLVARRLKPVTYTIFSSGFAGVGLEVVLLITFQIAYGYAYQMIGILITAFMVGLALGAHYGARVRSLLLPELGLMVLCFSPLLVLHAFIYPFLMVTIAFFVGMEFSIASRKHSGTVGQTASELYFLDFLGAAFGALLVSALLIPLMGIAKVCILLATLKLAGAMLAKTQA